MSINIKKLCCKEKSHIVLNFLLFKIKIRTLDFPANNQIFVVKDGKEHLVKNPKELKKIKITINGKNNKIVLSDYSQALNCRITLEGNCNEIIIKTNKLENVTIELHSSDSFIKIGENVILKDFYIVSDCGNNQKLIIEKNTTSYNTKVFLNEENASLYIGEDCMLSGEIVICPTDGHAIIDNISNEVLNLASTVKIGNHCWIGYGAYFTKNAAIADNTIVGAKSVVSKKFDENFITIVGNPAKIIKRNVRWVRENAAQVKQENAQRMLEEV